ncbi:PREDICTED: TMV resistance protein N-like [Ipomoea nil]|uniref:TMV resistance protein N-like n=1 Tax=Ipomoea nil TaxID=35883 RepID=UPI000900FAD3|nr:PREDICTED: TMV resistance protein N-like [Ipomoea nil]
MASSSSSADWSYHVFLSFRGDTRKSFTDHLYTNLCQAGINTFRDDEGIRKGESISDELLKAIEGSKISIIILSKNYARSRWCLDELVKILECKQNLGQIVFPIFYDVDPSEVRKQTGQFGDALIQHRERFGNQRVNEWKTALTTVANLSGWDLQILANGYESKFIKKITEEVVREVNRTYINVARYPVGIDSRVRDILLLLQTQTNHDVKMIGIFGMGGVGKTTLAKATYNLSFQRFEGCCFIANIRSQVSEGHNGLARLQEKILCKTLNRKKLEIDNVDEGISLIKERLRSKRVLVVLDDIDDTSQLESLAGQRNWFGSGSTIIITTRDGHLLSDLRAHEKYNVETLSSLESLELLSWHAFGVPIPSEEYIEISKRIASYTVGLPLALTIIGSHLRGRSVQEWSDNAEKLRRIPHDKVQNILKISYDALDDDTKNIFLDIACFFIGHDKNDTSTILEACGFYAEIGIKTLIERCLLTIDGGRVFEMHDLVRDMGRELVRKESPLEPGKRSRLFDQKDVFDVIRGNKGTEAIKGVIANSNMLKNVAFSTKIFRKMENLRILILNGVCLEGSFKYFPNEITFCRLHNCQLLSPVQTDFRIDKLVVFDFQGSNIKEFRPNMQHFRCLKILKFDGCEQLKETPNFTGAQSLQKVSFISCSNLVMVHRSIGSLDKLVELYFWDCEKLKELPSSICKLKSLEILFVQTCRKLKELPIDLGKLEQLRDLTVATTAISHIPFSLGCLRNLKFLTLEGNKGFVPSKSKSQLHGILSPHLWSRRTLDPVTFFPPSVANLCSLKRLDISLNYLHEVDLPVAIGNMSSLNNLDLSSSYNLHNLPFSLCHLSNLETLYLDNSRNLRALLELPPSLKSLSAKNCVSLKRIADVSNLKRLKWLYIPNCESLVELPGLENLESLIELDLTNCTSLTILCNYLHEVDLPISLRSLSSLKELYLTRSCSLRYFPFSFCHLSGLKNLYLDDLHNLRALPQLPPSLESLSAKNCGSLEKIADMSNLKRLYHLWIPNCNGLTIPFNYLHEVLGSLYSLKELDLMGSCSPKSLPFNLRCLSNLRRLYLDDWQNLKVIQELPPSLVILSAGNCGSLEKIVGISNLKGLEQLHVPNCKRLAELPGLENLESLRNLEVTNCTALRIPLIENWLQACCEGDSVKISVGVTDRNVICILPTFSKYRFVYMHSDGFHFGDCNGVRIATRSKTSGASAWVGDEELECSVDQKRKYGRVDFEVAVMVGEVVEVFAEFHHLHTLFLFEMHRNSDGQLRFFPSTRPLLQFDQPQLQLGE